jgi:hypothetical protein
MDYVHGFADGFAEGFARACELLAPPQVEVDAAADSPSLRGDPSEWAREIVDYIGGRRHPVPLVEIYEQFPGRSEDVIRRTLNRLVEYGWLHRPMPGRYVVPSRRTRPTGASHYPRPTRVTCGNPVPWDAWDALRGTPREGEGNGS